jgi:Holliday junction resolvase RusA-like endonuclease
VTSATETALAFTVAGDPVGKGRARIGRSSSGHVRTFTPEKTVRFEALVREAAQAALAGRAPLKGRARLRVMGYWTLARSHWKKREPIREAHRTSKPDADNVLKAVSDALNAIAWLDDSQVVWAEVYKFTAAQGEAGRTVVVVESLDGEWAP